MLACHLIKDLTLKMISSVVGIICMTSSGNQLGKVQMLQALTVATLLLLPQITLNVCHVCKKKKAERVSDGSSYTCSSSH